MDFGVADTSGLAPVAFASAGRNLDLIVKAQRSAHRADDSLLAERLAMDLDRARRHVPDEGSWKRGQNPIFPVNDNSPVEYKGAYDKGYRHRNQQKRGALRTVRQDHNPYKQGNDECDGRCVLEFPILVHVVSTLRGASYGKAQPKSTFVVSAIQPTAS